MIGNVCAIRHFIAILLIDEREMCADYVLYVMESYFSPLPAPVGSCLIVDAGSVHFAKYSIDPIAIANEPIE